MSKGIELYKEFIDGMVSRKNGTDAKRILGKGYPDTEEKRPYNELLAALSDEQKQVLAKLVQSAREGGIHDTLAYMDEMIDCDGLELLQNGEKFVTDKFDSMHYDFICRCEGAEWPEW